MGAKREADIEITRATRSNYLYHLHLESYLTTCHGQQLSRPNQPKSTK